MPFSPRNMPPLRLTRVHLVLEGPKSPLRQDGADTCKKGPPHRGAQIFADLLSRSLSRLQGDVAGEAVGDHDIDRAPAHVVAFDETHITNGKRRILENGGRLLDFVETLDLLDADIEEPDRRLLHAEQRPRHGRAHQRKLDQLARVGTDIGADIEHNALALDGGPDGGNGGAVDAGDRLQAELRHGHQRAGIAGGHRGVGAAVAHRFERKPHARFPAALAQRLTRLLVHGDGDVGVDDLRLGGERKVGAELRFDAGGIADHEEPRLGMTDRAYCRGGNDHAWTVVPAHGVERNGDWSTHVLLPFRKNDR